MVAESIPHDAENDLLSFSRYSHNRNEEFLIHSKTHLKIKDTLSYCNLLYENDLGSKIIDFNTSFTN